MTFRKEGNKNTDIPPITKMKIAPDMLSSIRHLNFALNIERFKNFDTEFKPLQATRAKKRMERLLVIFTKLILTPSLKAITKSINAFKLRVKLDVRANPI